MGRGRTGEVVAVSERGAMGGRTNQLVDDKDGSLVMTSERRRGKRAIVEELLAWR